MTERTPRLSELMGRDNDELDELWERLEATPPSERETRLRLFESFRQDLLDHIRIEEEGLFPLMLRLEPVQRALVDRLLDEHVRIREVLARISEELAAGSGPSEGLGRELVDVLWEHNAREEGSVYPWLDGRLTPVELDELRARLELHGRM